MIDWLIELFIKEGELVIKLGKYDQKIHQINGEVYSYAYFN